LSQFSVVCPPAALVIENVFGVLFESTVTVYEVAVEVTCRRVPTSFSDVSMVCRSAGAAAAYEP
jgi:hypothetical protein